MNNSMINPSVVDLLKKVEDRYSLVIVTSRRARQIAKGDKPLTSADDTSPVTIAANEIAEGKVEICRKEENNE